MSKADFILDPTGMHHYASLVIHTPHAGTMRPIWYSSRPESHYFLNLYAWPLFRVLTDFATDRLFAADMALAAGKRNGLIGCYDSHITQVSFPISRLFCDVERLKNDPLNKKGLGIRYDLYRLTKHSIPSCLTDEQIMSLYDTHHLILSQTIRNGCLLLDCHSFSEQDNVLCPDAHEYKDIDICIGYNEDETKPSQETIDGVARFLRERGYRVAFNTPFANSMTANTNKFYHSIMLEVNKHCYMDEETLTLTDRFDKLHADIQALYGQLLVPPFRP